MLWKQSLSSLATALTFGLVLIAALAPVSVDAATRAFTGATIHPISGPTLENGVLVVEDGRIAAVGAAGEVSVPAGAETVDLTGKTILPGLVDTHTHVGRVEGGDRSGPLHPEVRVLDAVDVRSPTFIKALAGGITTVNVMSGSGHLMSGQTVYLKIRREGTKIEDWTFCDDTLTGICGGMKMANGTNSIGSKPFPGTRAKSAALVRELFHEALAYRAKKEKAASGGAAAEPAGRSKKRKGAEKDSAEEEDSDEPPKAPDLDLGMEALLEILDGRRIVHFHTHRHNDVLTALRLAEEFGFRPVLHHVADASLVAEELAAAGVSCSLTGIDSPGGKEEALNAGWKDGANLEKAGVAVAFNTDDGITDSRYFLRSAAMAVRYGMSREAALAALTLTPAKMLGLADRVGSLEAGKDADFIVLSGDPLSVYTRVEETWVEGERVFDLQSPEDRTIAVGGEDAFPANAFTHHEDARTEWQ